MQSASLHDCIHHGFQNIKVNKCDACPFFICFESREMIRKKHRKDSARLQRRYWILASLLQIYLALRENKRFLNTFKPCNEIKIEFEPVLKMY